MKLSSVIVVVIVIFGFSGCSESGGPDGYQPPNLGSDTSGLTINDEPLGDGDSADGNFPSDGRYMGYVFQALKGEVMAIELTRVSGNDVPAIALYRFEGASWGEPLEAPSNR